MANLTDSALDFTIEFDNDTGKARYTDNLDYADYNVPAATIRGLGQAFNPLDSTLFIDKMSPASALIANLNTTTKQSIWYDLPLDTTSTDILNGSYSFLYAVYVPYTAVNQAVTSFGASNTIVVNGVDWSWLEAGDGIPVTLATTPANNGTKTVVSAIYNGSQTIITVSQTITVEAGGSAVINFAINKQYEKTITQSFTGCDEVTPILTLASDCTDSQFGSITATDNTVYGSQTIVSRTIQLYAPNGLVPAPAENPWETTESTQSSLTVSTLATGTWTGVLQAELSYTGTDGLVVLYSLSAPTNTFTTEVVCSTQLCDVDGCVANFWSSFYSCSAATPAMVLKATQLSLALNGYNLAKTCGDTSQMATYVAAIEEILGDDCTCGSSTGAPQWINNNSASGQTTIDQLQIEIDNLTAIVNDYQQGSELLFKATWCLDGDGSWGQIVPVTIPKEYYQIGTTAPYYESPAYAELIIDFKVSDASAQIVLYNQTDGAAWATLNVGAANVTSGRITMRWSSWNQLPACTLVTEYETNTNTYVRDETNLTGVAADWDLTQDLLINFLPTNQDDIVYAFVSLTGYKMNSATS